MRPLTGRRLRKAWHCAGRGLWRTTLLREGVAAATEHAALIESLRPDTVLDVGANRGQFTLLVKGLMPAATVMAFEPVDEALAVLNRVATGLHGITVVPVACGAERATTTLHVARDDDNSSLLPPTRQQIALAPGASTTHRASVLVEPLDDLVDIGVLRGTSLLKMDVQGTEIDVLQGSAGLLASLSYVYVELSFLERYVGQCRPADVVRHLEGSGFELVHLHNPVLGPRGLVQADALFARPSDDLWSPVLGDG